MVRTAIHTQDNKVIYSLLVMGSYGGYEDCVYILQKGKHTHLVGSCKTLMEVDGQRQTNRTYGKDALHFELKCTGVHFPRKSHSFSLFFSFWQLKHILDYHQRHSQLISHLLSPHLYRFLLVLRDEWDRIKTQRTKTNRSHSFCVSSYLSTSPTQTWPFAKHIQASKMQ